MQQIDPLLFNPVHFHRLLLGSVAPRPIALASTLAPDGTPNLSPFSFFNAFGVNPATLIFSPSRRGRDNTTKHTFENIKLLPEVVINVVTYSMVQQTSLSSTEYPAGVNEFVKSGLTPVPSERIRPMRVKESPVQFECRVREIIETGQGPGAGNLVICDILLMHIDEGVMDAHSEIDQDKIDLVGRMGGNYYVRTGGDAKFIVPKPLARLGIGIDQLPEKIRFSHLLTGNDLGQLGNVEKMPDEATLRQLIQGMDIEAKLIQSPALLVEEARRLLGQEKPEAALALLVAYL